MEIPTSYNFFFAILQKCFFVEDICKNNKNNNDNSVSDLREEYTSLVETDENYMEMIP